MIVIDNPHIMAFDVDSTLIVPYVDRPDEYISDDDIVYIGDSAFIKHRHHIDMMKLAKTRKHLVLVWSQGGHEWASTVIKALDLEPYVDIIMTKVSWIVDDLNPGEWTKRYYLDLNGKSLLES